VATSRFFERRSIRNQLKIYLEKKGWTDLTWSEGFSALSLATVEPPFISVILEDLGKATLEMGNNAENNKLFNRRAQINVYMESADRVDALMDEIGDFMDMEAIIIKDNNNNVLGSMISDTESILMTSIPPDTAGEADLEWHGIVACLYETYYP
jgi:hypothetical protein